MNARAPAVSRRLGRGAVVLAGFVGVMGCVIPDGGINIEGEFDNPGAIRIVEPTPITPRADQDCDERTIFGGCPTLPDTAPTGLIRPESPLCVCPGGADLGLGKFDLFVEDPDRDEEGNARDDLLGALFLDVPPGTTDIGEYLAYVNLLAPDEPATRFLGAQLEAIERAAPVLKSWELVPPDRQRIDLCNNNDGTPLSPGLHQITVMVTDRPWFQPVVLDEDDNIVVDEDGEPELGEVFYGVPDLAGGATYDTTSYVFQCFDAADPPEGIECNCEV